MQDANQEPKVQLRHARVPGLAGKVAVHYWFVVNPQAEWERWEVWQNPNVCRESWDHIHKNLKRPDLGVGNGPSQLENEWEGEEAAKIIMELHRSPEIYPARELYRMWPGPNSNTFIQWILNSAGIPHKLGLRGIGAGFVQFLPPSRNVD